MLYVTDKSGFSLLSFYIFNRSGVSLQESAVENESKFSLFCLVRHNAKTLSYNSKKEKIPILNTVTVDYYDTNGKIACCVTDECRPLFVKCDISLLLCRVTIKIGLSINREDS